MSDGAAPGVFISVPFGTGPDWRTGTESNRYSPSRAERLTQALCREIETRAPTLEGTVFATVYFGGPGPACLSLDQLYRILQSLYDNLRVEPVEQTIVVAAGAVDEPKVKVLRESGFDRTELRVEHPEKAGSDFRVLRDAGFTTVGVESCYETDAARWSQALSALLKLEPDHCALYPGPRCSELGLLYALRRAREKLGSGYRNYALSHFCRPGHECQHLRAAWSGSDIAGFGPGARSRTGSMVAASPAGFTDYLAAAESCTRPASAPLLPREKVRDQLIGLLGIEVTPQNHGSVRSLVARGLVEQHEGRAFLTDQGAVALDRVSRELAGAD